MRVVAKNTLVKFWSQPECADSKGALQSWFDEAIKASWKNPAEHKRAIQQRKRMWQQPGSVQHCR